MIAEVACRALAYQDADEAWEALKNITVSGLFDHNRQAAIKQLGNTRNPKYAASISTALTIKNWHGRHKAVKALGKFEGPEASFLLLAFLHEIEPTVRHAVIQRLNPSYDLVNRRLLWNAVNDPSERVRAESYAKLIASPIPEYRGEGYKGIRDESLTIRLGLLDHLKQNPSENHREALRLAIIDTSPLVRAATLRAFATLPKEVRFEEIENTLSDSDSRVQEALLELAEAKKLQLPEATLKLLKQSKSPVVRERVSRL
jgi:HEAT repeat protein